MNAGSAGGGAAGAAIARYNSRIKYQVAEEDGREYLFVHYPDEVESRRLQPVLRVDADDMADWERSVKRFNSRCLLGFAGIFSNIVIAIFLFNLSHVRINVFFDLAICIALIFVLCAPVYWWISRIEKKELRLRQEILNQYGYYKSERVWTVRGLLRGDSDGNTRNADHLLMEEGEVL